MGWTPTTGTDEDAIHDNVAGEINAIAEKVTPASGDLLVIEDSESSYAKKKVQIGNLPSSGGSCELLMQDGVTGPPVPIETEARDDWLYEDSCDGSSGGSVSASFSGAVVHLTGTTQNVLDQTYTAISFGTEDYDSDNYWDGANPTRFTVPTDGLYRLEGNTRMDGQASFDTAAGQFISLRFRRNGGTTGVDFWGEDFRRAIQANDPGHHTQAVAKLDAGDYVELVIYQNSGETLTVPGDTTLYARMSIERLVDLT